MSNFLGEFEVTKDSKDRFIIPAGFKRQYAEGDGVRFVLCRGFDKCLNLYTENQWKKVEAKVSRMNDFNMQARKLKRIFLNGATFLEPDGSSRLLIPKKMLEYAGITKDIIFSAQLNKVELWDAETYNKQTEEDVADMNNLANEVLGGEFLNPFDGE